MKQTSKSSGPIVLFDGVCNLCNASVRFILNRDGAKRFTFGSLQSLKAKQLLEQYGLGQSPLSTIVLISNGRAHTESSAALRIALMLDGPWPFLGLFLMVPKFLRDFVYRFVARNRYKWFGKTDYCQLPSAETKTRFLNFDER